MSWESYHKEIIKAKDEYDSRLKPILEVLEKVEKEAWEVYVKRIVRAEVLLKEEES